MNRYLESYHLKDFLEYLNSKAIEVIKKQEQLENFEKDFYRGLYKGYLISIVTIKHILRNRLTVKIYELYNHFKFLKTKYMFYVEVNNLNETGNVSKRGIKEAFYNILNYLTSI